MIVNYHRRVRPRRGKPKNKSEKSGGAKWSEESTPTAMTPFPRKRSLFFERELSSLTRYALSLTRYLTHLACSLALSLSLCLSLSHFKMFVHPLISPEYC